MPRVCCNDRKGSPPSRAHGRRRSLAAVSPEKHELDFDERDVKYARTYQGSRPHSSWLGWLGAWLLFQQTPDQTEECRRRTKGNLQEAKLLLRPSSSAIRY